MLTKLKKKKIRSPGGFLEELNLSFSMEKGRKLKPKLNKITIFQTSLKNSHFCQIFHRLRDLENKNVQQEKNVVKVLLKNKQTETEIDRNFKYITF